MDKRFSEETVYFKYPYLLNSDMADINSESEGFFSSEDWMTKIVVILLAVIMVGAILVPFLGQASKTDQSFSNENVALQQMSLIESGDEWTTEDYVHWSLNGEPITTPVRTCYPVLTDNLIVDEMGHSAGPDSQYLSSNRQLNTISVNGSELNCTSSYDSFNTTFTKGFGLTTDGQYILNTKNTKEYVLEDTEFYGYVSTLNSMGIPGGGVHFYISGDIENGVEVVTVRNATSITNVNIEITDISINYTVVSGYDNLYMLDTVTFHVSGSFYSTVSHMTSNVNNDITCSQFVVPKETSAHISSAPSPITATLLNILPVFLGVAIILLITGTFFYKREQDQ